MVLSNLILAKKMLITVYNNIFNNNRLFDWAYMRESKFQRSYPISKLATTPGGREEEEECSESWKFRGFDFLNIFFFFRHRVEVYSLYGRALWSPYARSLWKIAAHFTIWRPVGLPWCNMVVNAMGSEVIKTARLDINGENHETRLPYICRLWK